MGLIKEPLGVDLVVDPRPLTAAEEFLLNEYIKNDKLARYQTGKEQPQYVVQEEAAVYQKQANNNK
jgi:hypothetical protein